MDNSCTKNITLVNIETELKNSYLDYAMSVIVGRALPDVRDGLKPVHRRILYAMHILGNLWNKPYKKSARIVGDVIGKYHPHGDAAVYDTIVRLAQNFSLRYTLIDGQGNFGSIDGDSAAAMRYTEIRMTKITQEIIKDIDKKTVNFLLNYDGTEKIPAIMPTKIPNILINGSSGIAVGMTTNIPPHNLTEIINGCIAYIHDNNISTKELMQYIPGPDFPTSGVINGTLGIQKAYDTGKGQIIIRGRSKIIKYEQYNQIIIYELPYQINKAKLIEKIIDLIKNKKINGIKNLRDESDQDGIRIVIDIKKNVSANIILNNLYKFTPLQSTFNINMVALYKNKPLLMPLKKIIIAFIEHRREIVIRRTQYEIKKYNDKAHILEGLIVALINIKDIINIIQSSTRTEVIRNTISNKTWNIKNIIQQLNLQNKNNCVFKDTKLIKYENHYSFSLKQVQAILDLKLYRLTNLEYQKLCDEYQQIIYNTNKLSQILNNDNYLMNIICNELINIKKEFGDNRKTKIINTPYSMNIKDLIIKENVIVTLTYKGYIKYQKLSEYDVQHRGGKGKFATKINQNDYISKLLIVNTHDNIILLSNLGRLYWLKVYDLPFANRFAKGKPIINILPLKNNERIITFLVINSYPNDINLFIVTQQGFVKQTSIQQFSKPRKNGIIAIKLRSNDLIQDAALIKCTQQVMLFSALGKVVKFNSSTVKNMGRNTLGMRGIRFTSSKDRVVSLIILTNTSQKNILTITQNGYGKRTINQAYPLRSRATKGVIAIKTNIRNGQVVGSIKVSDNDHILIITNTGSLIRINVSEISLVSRNTNGVIIVKINKNEQVISLQKI
ncbi:DNA topoisomerase (ATP-hydrolyzing) subunit A [Enterobacteriaceae endosymbiont of Neohaemonia nigricornis]|uniref:DNA topoisomerase (ATP-hydrolyzing) subunit A n=1 Tax=Enterobacteriaceae endosymbiont of Neohaemonia nigricornis TaxID=2675792 RepID=UPI0014490AE1|nr:DNA topoisomerase (ATP-hydrolyzing) subunit A [Enterobacteriaceae endosymbiont of Neohaemonia nigricornis]QJC30335.1 DNA topoisomerase (ATP-hydrolyzing) subunit A [Enterobacteriaceae endosymbiont of Neohaemonia nigricornis]